MTEFQFSGELFLDFVHYWLWYSVFIRILEDDNEEPIPIPKTQMLAINVWPTTHENKKAEEQELATIMCLLQI